MSLWEKDIYLRQPWDSSFSIAQPVIIEPVTNLTNRLGLIAMQIWDIYKEQS